MSREGGPAVKTAQKGGTQDRLLKGTRYLIYPCDAYASASHAGGRNVDRERPLLAAKKAGFLIQLQVW